MDASCQDVHLLMFAVYGHTPSTAGTFWRKFQINSGKTPETLSERFLEFPSRVRLGCPKPYNSRHLRLPEHFQNSLPLSTAGDASFFRSASGEGLSEPVMEFPAVLGAFPSLLFMAEKDRLETGIGRYLLEAPFSEPLLRTILRTLFYCKTHSRPPYQNPSETLPQNPSQNLLGTLLRTLCCRTTP